MVAKCKWARVILFESISFSHLQLLSLNGWKILLVRKDIYVYLCYSCETVCLETFMSLLKQIQIMQLFCCFFSSMLSSYFGLPFLCIHSRVCLSRKNCNLFSFWIFTATWGPFVHGNRKQKKSDPTPSTRLICLWFGMFIKATEKKVFTHFICIIKLV